MSKFPLPQEILLLSSSTNDGAVQNQLTHSLQISSAVSELYTSSMEAFKRGDLEEAFTGLTEVLSEQPYFLTGWVKLGACLIRATEFDKAETVFRAILAQEPSFVPARKLFAQIAQGQKNWALALERWESLLNEDPGDRRALQMRVRNLLYLRQYQKAEASCLELLERYPEDFELASLLVLIYEQQFKLRLAKERCSALTAASGPDPQTLNFCANFYVRQREFRKAEVLFESLLTVESHELKAHIGLAKIALNEKDPVQALSITVGALKKFPTDIDLLRLSAKAERNLGNVPDALAIFKKIISLEPDNSAGYEGLASTTAFDEHQEEALLLWENVLEKFPGSVSALIGLNSTLIYLEQFDRAIKETETFLEIYPEHQEGAFKQLVHLYRVSENYEKALRTVNRCINQFPAILDFKLTKLTLLLLLRRFSQAYMFATNLSQTFGESIQFWKHLGSCAVYFHKLNQMFLRNRERFLADPIFRDTDLYKETAWVGNYLEKSSNEVWKPTVSQEIDIVYLWIDPDETWRKSFETTIGRPYFNSSNRGQGIYRYRNNMEILFSLRTVDAFFKECRNVYIVTAGQTFDISSLPETIQRKIKFIFHEEIITPELAELPTFNSSVIESFLWRIPGLSEVFLYSNDDMFLGKKLDRDLIFNKNNVPYSYMIPKQSSPHVIEIKLRSRTSGFHLGMDSFNASSLFAKHFGVEPNREISHQMAVLHKQSFETVFYYFFEEFRHRLFKEKVRGKNNHRVTSISNYYALLYGYQEPCNYTRLLKESISLNTEFSDLWAEKLLNWRPQFFCINNTGDGKVFEKFAEDYLKDE